MTNAQKIAWYEYQIKDCRKHSCAVCARYQLRIEALQCTEIPKQHQAKSCGALKR